MTANKLIPWYKQFWPWFVVGIPIFTIISGIGMIIVASHKPDGMVVDDYYKSGLAINRTIARDKHAAQLGQQASLHIANRHISLTLTGQEHPKNLFLHLTHPTATQQDMTINLLQENNKAKYSGTLASIPNGKRYLLLEPKDQSWRLVGSGTFPNEQGIALNPDI